MNMFTNANHLDIYYSTFAQLDIDNNIKHEPTYKPTTKGLTDST